MNVTYQRIPSSRARETVLRELGIRESEGDPASILAELVRSGLWANTEYGEDEWGSPVHRRRIVSYGEASAAVLFDADDPDGLLSQTIDELEAIGEIARLPNGYFRPAPLRWIQGEVGVPLLLIGGVPTHVLSDPVRAGLQHRHLVRYGIPELSEGIPYQSQRLWIDKPTESLEAWAGTVMEQARRIAQPTTTDQLARDGCEVYPYATPKSQTLQHFRWGDRLHRLVNRAGVYLARQRREFGAHLRYLLWVENSGITKAEIDASVIDVRRLMYALDAKRGMPTSASLAIHESHADLVLSNELPKAEQKLLTALATHIENESGRYYPRRWRMSRDHLGLVRSALEDLRVLIMENPS